uniref:Uncharacterized protein n=1 Tax=viral metagenome TaxID=1070528 RepID=A0A6M3LLQ4_9ZZZZ
MEIKLGLLAHKYEMGELNNIIDARKKIKAFKETIVPMLKILADSGINIDHIDPTWCTCVHLGEGQLLPERVYSKLSDLCGDHPEMKMSDESGVFYFSPIKHDALWGIAVYLKKLKCTIIKTTTKKWKEVEEIHYEVDGDCSGISYDEGGN